MTRYNHCNQSSIGISLEIIFQIYVIEKCQLSHYGKEEFTKGPFDIFSFERISLLVIYVKYLNQFYNCYKYLKKKNINKLNNLTFFNQSNFNK